MAGFSIRKPAIRFCCEVRTDTFYFFRKALNDWSTTLKITIEMPT